MTLPALLKDSLNIRLSPDQDAAFQTYKDELLRWNEQINLTAITAPNEIAVRHFADSLSCVRALKPIKAGMRIIDVGTGAGFPGLPIKLIHPDIHLTLLESRGKKVDFLDHIITTLGLDDVNAIKGRAEELGQDPTHRESYDRVVARAVAHLNVLAEYLLPLCAVGGHCVAMKGKTAEREVEEAREAIKTLGGRVTSMSKVALPGRDTPHYLIEIKKEAPTPIMYPRRPGRPSKKPL